MRPVSRSLRTERWATAKFFILAYAVSWAFWLPIAWADLAGAGRQVMLVAGTFGPGIAAVVMMVGVRGLTDFRQSPGCADGDSVPAPGY